MNNRKGFGTWICTWCRNEIRHDVPYRTPLAIEDGWPSGTGQLVCGPGCRQRPSGTPVYQHWGRGRS